MVGIHARTGREKISSRHIAHVLNDETQRKYIQVNQSVTMPVSYNISVIVIKFTCASLLALCTVHTIFGVFSFNVLQVFGK